MPAVRSVEENGDIEIGETIRTAGRTQMDDRTGKDALLEALETILRESRRLRGELHEDSRAGMGGDEGERPAKPDQGGAAATA
jgi:hypothetical protein